MLEKIRITRINADYTDRENWKECSFTAIRIGVIIIRKQENGKRKVDNEKVKYENVN